MARMPLSKRQKAIVSLIYIIRLRDLMMMFLISQILAFLELLKKPHKKNVHSAKRSLIQGLKNVNEFLRDELSCFDQLRMDRGTFHKLCELLKDYGGLKESKNMFVEERVAIFLNILGHDQKQRAIVRRLRRSKETITRNFREVLKCVLRLHKILLKAPEPIQENCNDERWKWFKNCIGALDGTFIKLKVPEVDKPRYRTRKGDIATNVLAACSKDMQFTYVLPGWEGSAADSRILKDAISRAHPLKISRGDYLLVDAGFTNGEGFLAPYRGQRYHLKEWKDGYKSTTPQEYFNMKHSAARNVIERCFGLLKMRWAVLRNSSSYGAETHADIISACCLLHNLIRREMQIDPLEPLLDTEFGRQFVDNDDAGGDYINVVETSNAWTLWRDNLARQMFDNWRLHRGAT